MWQQIISAWRRSVARSTRSKLRRRNRTYFLEAQALEVRVLLSAWNGIGPAPVLYGQLAGNGAVSGRITGIAADPVDANTIYIASAGGGVWKTTTGGSSWTPLTDNLTSGGKPLPSFMGAVAETRDTSSHQIVYAGMGEANNADSFYGDGILVSQDGGASWTLTDAGGALTGQSVSRISIDPNDTSGGTAYAAVADFGSNHGLSDTGIWKTTNFGTTWTNTTSSLPFFPTQNEWSDVVVDPAAPGTVYAAEGTFFGSAGNGVYKTTDGGGTWSWLTGSGSFNGIQDGRIALAVYDSGGTQELLVSISVPTGLANSEQLFKMLKSTDGGASFNTLASTPNYLREQGSYDTALAISPTDPNYFYAAGAMSAVGPTFSGSPIESLDGGISWLDIATDPAGNGPHTDSHAAAFDAAGNLLDGDDGGIFKLTQPTDVVNQRWSDLNTNLSTIQFTGIAVDPTDASIAYGGSQDNGTEKFTGGSAWAQIQDGDGGITRVDPTNHNRIYAEHTDVSIQRSDNGGATFTNITAGLRGNAVNFYAPYVLDSSGDILYGEDWLNRSTDHGATWTQIAKDNVNGFNPSDANIDAIAVARSSNDVIYVSAGSKIYVTQNATAADPAGVTWTNVSLPLGLRAGASNSLAVDPANPGTAYAVVVGFGHHIFKTTNYGAAWTEIGGNFVDTFVASVSANGSIVYVGTDVGVYATNNAGASWSRLGTGLPNARVVELEVLPSLQILAAGTHGRGMSELNIAPATVTNVSSSTANGSYGIGATISINVTFNDTVTATGTPQLALNSGGTASYSSGSSTNTLTFTYTVQAGDNSAHLDYTSTSALSLNGGTITDSSLNAAVLALLVPSAVGSLGANSSIVIDTVVPATSSFVRQNPSTTPTNANTLVFRTTFSEMVKNVGTSSFKVAGTTTAAVINVTPVAASNGAQYDVTVSEGDLATFNGLVGLALGSGEQITDLAGNALANIAPPIDQAYLLDHVPPAVPTVNPRVTNNVKPILTGTWDQGSPGGAVLLQVTVNGTTFTLGMNPQLASDGAGHWTLTTTATIPDGFYNVLVHTADAAGNSSDLTSTNGLIVNTVAPASIAFAGAYAVSTNGSLNLTLASITQNGNQLTLTSSTTTTATVTSTSQLQVGGTTAVYGDSVISFGSTGPFANQVWTKLDLPANYTTARGTATHVTTNGNSINFVDENGVSSPGTWINPKQLTAFGATVTIGNGTLMFSNGTIWYENVSLPGTLNGAGSTNISAAPRQFTVLDFTNPSGKSVHLIETGTTSVVFVDGLNRMSLGSFSSNTQALADLYPGDTATFAGGLVLWQDGSVWAPAATPSPQITVTDYTNQNGVATHVIRNGTANVAFADGMGQLSLGAFVNTTQANSNAYPNDVATFDATTVSWQDHSVWTKTGSLTGAGMTNTSPFTVVDYTNLSGTPVHLIKTGTSELIFVDGLGRISLGAFINATQAMADLYPGDAATFSGGLVLWHDGSLWLPAATPSPQITVTDFLNQNGVATHIIRNGSVNLAFVDGLGQFSLGTFLNATQAISNAYPNDVATFAGITVTWQDGSVWTRNGFPPITTLAKDANGALSHLKFLSSTMFIGVDGVMQGVRGTRLNGKIFWMNGQTWDNLNFNALNACFEMGTGYP